MDGSQAHTLRKKRLVLLVILGRTKQFNMPMTDIDISTWKFPPDVMLADRDFHKSAPIDILLGAEIFFDILMHSRYDCKGLAVLQNTKLGYILSGKMHQSYVKKYKKQCHSLFVQTDSLHNMMWFWSIEEMNNKVLTKEEKACEEHFKLHKRLETGQYEVRLPLSDSVDKLGESYDTARAKFLALQQRPPMSNPPRNPSKRSSSKKVKDGYVTNSLEYIINETTLLDQ